MAPLRHVCRNRNGCGVEGGERGRGDADPDPEFRVVGGREGEWVGSVEEGLGGVVLLRLTWSRGSRGLALLLSGGCVDGLYLVLLMRG